MMYTKKIIGVSSALFITGVGMMSSASAMTTMGSADGSMSMSNGASSTESGSINSVGEQRQENQKEKAQMYQGIKTDRANMNQGIKDDKVKMQEENMQNRQMMGSGMIKPLMGSGGELSPLLKNPMNTEEKIALKTLMNAHQAARDLIMKDTTLTPEARVAKMKELMTTHFTDLLIYIAPDKQDAFKKVAEEKLAQMEKNQQLHKENKDNRQEFKDKAKEIREDFKTQVQAKKQALSEKNKELLIKVVNTLTLEKLQTILTRVEKAISLTKKEKVIDQLNEIGDMIQNKIDELTGTTSEDTVIADILGTTSSNVTK